MRSGASRRALLATALSGLVVAGCGSDTGSHGAGTLVFWSLRGGHPGVWSMRPDGSDARLITRFFENAKRGVISPDGRRLAFDGAPRGAAPMVNFDLQVMNLDGSHRRRLTADPAREIDAQWSPGGELLSFSRQLDAQGRKSSIWTIHPDGTHARRLVEGQLARWSPEGHRIVFARSVGSGSDLLVLDLRSGRVERLDHSPVHEEPAAWSPDGRRVLSTRYGTNADVYLVRTDGSGTRRLTRSAADEVAAAFSPDGTQIAFTRSLAGHDQVFTMRLDGGETRNVSRSSSDDSATQWFSGSPAGA